MESWILNLTEGFGPSAKDLRAEEIEYEYTVFPGGEPHISLKNFDTTSTENNYVVVSIRIQSFNDIGKLAVAVNALEAIGNCDDMQLLLPYFPGARQDRIANPGEALTVKVYADMINEMGFNGVHILDPHSDVTPALIDNVIVKNNYGFVHGVLNELNAVDVPCTINIVSPDAGANKKIKDLVMHLCSCYPEHHFEIIKCDKTRDTKSGKISGFEVHAEEIENTLTIVVDDICDGGGTFIGLAKALEAYDVSPLVLAVSHGIFSKGFEELDKHFDRIFTTDSFGGQRGNSVTEIKLEYGL